MACAASRSLDGAGALTCASPLPGKPVLGVASAFVAVAPACVAHTQPVTWRLCRQLPRMSTMALRNCDRASQHLCKRGAGELFVEMTTEGIVESVASGKLDIGLIFKWTSRTAGNPGASASASCAPSADQDQRSTMCWAPRPVCGLDPRSQQRRDASCVKAAKTSLFAKALKLLPRISSHVYCKSIQL